MMRLPRSRLALALLLLLAAIVYLSGINWGLPSRAADPFLFGDKTPWTGAQIIQLAGGWEDHPDVGADVALNPLSGRDRVLELNQTDVQRAQIVRRYRLFSYQPDEMITLRALADMKPARLQLDPKLYQYGGLWIYPVGVLLEIGSKLGLVQLRGDVSYYLDHPEEFGRFYVVARFYTVLWALVGVAAVDALVRRIIGGWIFPSLAAACFIFMPVVMNMAHEAKPHLPGAVLMLLAVLAGARYVESGSRRCWVAVGVLCGAALGMVLSSLPSFIILPLMVLLRWTHTRSDADSQSTRTGLHEDAAAGKSDDSRWIVLAGSTIIAIIVYLITNPYVPINLIHNRAVLRSNFGNSTAMYHAQFSAAGVAHGLKLIAVGTAPLLAVVGAIGAVALGMRALHLRNNRSAMERNRRATGLLLALPAIWVCAQCLALAAGKPGEFARFAIFPDVFLMIEAIVAIATFARKPALAGLLLCILWITTALPGLNYLRAFIRDSSNSPGRLALAQHLSSLSAAGDRSLAVYAEPAPYCSPPVDLWRWSILLMPRGAKAGDFSDADVQIWTIDTPPDQGLWGWIVGTPISWANKPFEIRQRHKGP